MAGTAGLGQAEGVGFEPTVGLHPLRFSRPSLSRLKSKIGKSLDHSNDHLRSPCASELIETPPDLAAVIDAWPTLPEAIRTGIVAMIKAAGEGARAT